MEKKIFYSHLVWLFPAAFFFHICEEAPSFPFWVENVLKGHMDVRLFYVNNAAFMIVLLGLALFASRKRNFLSTFLLFLWVSGQQFWNFVFHLYTQFHFNAYSPGLWTATFLYFPIFLYMSYLAIRESFLSWKALLFCVIAGAGGMWFTICSGLYHFEEFPWASWI